MAIPEGAIYSEDGAFVIGVRDRKDRYGNILPESEWMYKKKIPVKNMEALISGAQSAEIRRVAAEAKKATHEDRMQGVLKGLEKGLTRSKAAKAANVPWSSVRERLKVDPVFAEAIADAEAVWLETVRSVVFDEIVINKNAELGLRVLSKLDPAFADKKEVNTTTVTRLELPDGDRVAGVLSLIERLNDRKELATGKVIDVESEEA